jgi:hypothetical protein
VHIEPNAESVPVAARIRVHVFAKDVDDLPIPFTRAEISLGFGAQTIPVQWSRGSNEYVADVPAELIVVGAAATTVVILGVLVIVVRKRNAHLQAIMAMLFTEVSAFQIPLETPFGPSPAQRRCG